jgi:hypothetical protein
VDILDMEGSGFEATKTSPGRLTYNQFCISDFAMYKQ